MAQRTKLPPDTLGLRLKMARIRAGLTLKEVERRTGYAESVLSRYERNRSKRGVPAARLARIAEAVGTTAAALLDGLDFGPTRVDLNGKPLVVAA